MTNSLKNNKMILKALMICVKFFACLHLCLKHIQKIILPLTGENPKVSTLDFSMQNYAFLPIL